MLESILLGFGLTLAARWLAWPLSRPVAKAVLQGGLAVATAAREAIAQAGEALSDLVAEVQHEAAAPGASAHVPEETPDAR
jgi:hypothetical protein